MLISVSFNGRKMRFTPEFVVKVGVRGSFQMCVNIFLDVNMTSRTTYLSKLLIKEPIRTTYCTIFAVLRP